MFINSYIKSIRKQAIMLAFQAGYVRKSARQKGSEAAWTPKFDMVVLLLIGKSHPSF